MQPVGSGPISILSLERPRHKRMARTAITSLLVAGMFGCCQPNDRNCRNVSIGPSGAEVAGVVLGVGAVAATVIAVEVHHAHHTLSGCTSDGPGGMQLQKHGSSKAYMLSGNMSGTLAGERVRLHGTRIKQRKHSRTDPLFSVERKDKDFGPCKFGSPFPPVGLEAVPVRWQSAPETGEGWSKCCFAIQSILPADVMRTFT